MSPWWQYFWPLFAGGLVGGIIAGALGLRRGALPRATLAGAAAVLALALLWHGPLGASDRFARAVEAKVRFVLNDWEMSAIASHLQRAPLTRRVELSGRADEFQRGELVKIINQVPGVSSASWGTDRGVPLVAEGIAAAILGFLFGLLFAYLIELRRRHNAQWNW